MTVAPSSPMRIAKRKGLENIVPFDEMHRKCYYKSIHQMFTNAERMKVPEFDEVVSESQLALREESGVNT